MKATKLIQELSKQIAAHGDKDVDFYGAVLDFGGGGEAAYNTLSASFVVDRIVVYGEEYDS